MVFVGEFGFPPSHPLLFGIRSLFSVVSEEFKGKKVVMSRIFGQMIFFFFKKNIQMIFKKKF